MMTKTTANKRIGLLLALVMILSLSFNLSSVFAAGSAFTDISGHWAEDAIIYCCDSGVMVGTSETTFDPDVQTTAEMLKTVLSRVSGTDIQTTEADSSSIYREDAASLIAQYIFSGETAAENNFSDAILISADDVNGVNVCLANGIMTGKENNAFDPQGYLTRAELAVIAQRIYVYYNDAYTTINIIHTNDMHGSLTSTSSTIGVDLVAALKESTENAILVDAGDATQGIAFASLTQGADVISAMNIAGYDLMTAGNHEFDYGVETLLQNAANADFPILSANAYYNSKPLFETTYANGEKTNNGCNTIIEIDGVRVGFFGITTCETATSTNPEGLEGVTFADEIETSREQIADLKEQGADVIIGVMHMGVNATAGVTSTEAADALGGEGLDAIIDGHSHSVVNTVENGVAIGQTGSSSANVGMLTVRIAEDGEKSLSERLISATELAGTVTPDPEVTEFLNSVNEEQAQLLGEEVAESAVTLWGGYINSVSETRVHETNLGDIICDSMIARYKEVYPDDTTPVVAANNGGGIRATIYAGTVTKEDTFNVLPFANTLLYKTITPKILYDIMETSLSANTSQDPETGMITGEYSGGFLQIGGMTVEYNPNSPAGEKVIGITLDSSDSVFDKNDDSTPIIFMSNDFVMGGGNGYDMLADISVGGEFGSLEEIFRNYIVDLTNGGSEALDYPITQNRIVPVSDYQATDYAASVYVRNSDGSPLANTEVEVTIDYNESVTVSTNENGLAEITVTNGPHSISLTDDPSAAVYVNNYSGQGIIEVEGDYPVPFPSIVMSAAESASNALADAA